MHSLSSFPPHVQVVHDIVQSVVPSLSSSEDEDLTDSDGPGKRSNNKHGVLHPTMQSVVPPLSSSEDEDLTDSNGPNERMSNTPRIFAEGRQVRQRPTGRKAGLPYLVPSVEFVLHQPLC
mmetsp:Transcript_11618/g.25460  ORF Transcript_11618/g.25460 Transcript_11618/m.25460 type:complete len:120 (-) Transcript_11618:728-1087(-)